jgi:hypothetical protein
MPRTSLGRWSALLMGGFVAMMGLFFVAVAAGQRGGDAFFDNLWLAAPAILAWTSGAAAGVTGLWAIIDRAERAPLVFLAVAIGLIVIAFGGAELAFPH